MTVAATGLESVAIHQTIDGTHEAITKSLPDMFGRSDRQFRFELGDDCFNTVIDGTELDGDWSDPVDATELVEMMTMWVSDHASEGQEDPRLVISSTSIRSENKADRNPRTITTYTFR